MIWQQVCTRLIYGGSRHAYILTPSCYKTNAPTTNTHHNSSERYLAMNFELVGRGHALTGVDQDVREQEEHPLLVAFTRQLVKTALSNEMLQIGPRQQINQIK